MKYFYCIIATCSVLIVPKIVLGNVLLEQTQDFSVPYQAGRQHQFFGANPSPIATSTGNLKQITVKLSRQGTELIEPDNFISMFLTTPTSQLFSVNSYRNSELPPFGQPLDFAFYFSTTTPLSLVTSRIQSIDLLPGAQQAIRTNIYGSQGENFPGDSFIYDGSTGLQLAGKYYVKIEDDVNNTSTPTSGRTPILIVPGILGTEIKKGGR